MELKPGYKLTEVGVIPKDWEVEVLGDVFDISGGVSASRDQLSTDGHCYLHYGDIHKSAKNFIDVHTEYLDIPKLNIPLNRVSSKSLLSDGDIVFVDASEDDEGTSKHVVIVNAEGVPYISGLHTIVAKSKTSSFNNVYKRYCFQTSDIKRQFYFYAVGTKVSGISKTNIKRVFIPRPPLSEQRAIAEALSDVDALIGALDRLIAKKRDLKKAAMQQLLTGQTRLPGFSGEWEVTRLGDEIILITKGTTPTSLGKSFTKQGINFLKVESFTEDGNVIPEMMAAIDENTHRLLKRSQLRENDILFSIAGALGRTTIVKRSILPANTNQALAIIRLKPFSLLQHIFLLKYLAGPQICSHINAINVQAAQANLSLEDIRNFEVPRPSTAEQTAIAAVLSDMDAEIAALEARRDKTRLLKQGMMQELLTGRTRLI